MASTYIGHTPWGAAVAAWLHGDHDRALQFLRQELQLMKQMKDPIMAAIALETLAWIAGTQGSARHVAMLLGAATTLTRSVGSSTVLFPGLAVHHDESERAARDTLGQRAFETTYREGAALDLDSAIAYALEEKPPPTAPAPAQLTKRERQVADLVADGLTNKAIAVRLHLSQRTAEGHVEHILTKLGFTSRAQIAAWIARQSRLTR